MDWTEIPKGYWKKYLQETYTMHDIENRYKIMEDTYNIFKDIGLPVWMSFGSLLTIYRDGKLKQNDDDVDFSCRTEDMAIIFKKLRKRLVMSGYDIRAHVNTLKIQCFKYGEQVSLASFSLVGKWRQRKIWKFPAKFFEQFGEIECRGVKYPCHIPIEDYLEWLYGDWKISKEEGYWTDKVKNG